MRIVQLKGTHFKIVHKHPEASCEVCDYTDDPNRNGCDISIKMYNVYSEPAPCSSRGGNNVLVKISLKEILTRL